MPLLLGFLCLLFLLLFGVVALAFTIDVLFHEVLPNDWIAAAIVVISGLLLVATTIVVAKSRRRGIKAVAILLAFAIPLLLLQPILQDLGRSYTRASLEAAWQELRSGLEIANLADEPISMESGGPIGLRLSFDMIVAGDASFQFFPHAESESTPPHFLESVRFERQPAPETGESKSRFEAGRTYRLVYDLVPSLLAWDRDNEAFCLRHVGTTAFWRMAGPDSAPASMKIELGGVLFESSHQSFSFEAESRARYDIKAMGEAGLAADFPLCGPKVAKQLLYEE
jgi:hypothetical protein